MFALLIKHSVKRDSYTWAQSSLLGRMSVDSESVSLLFRKALGVGGRGVLKAAEFWDNPGPNSLE